MTFPDWIMTHGGDLQAAGFFALLVAFAVAERFVPRRQAHGDRSLRWRTNLILTAINVAVLSALPLSFLAAALWAEEHGWGLLNAVSLPLAPLIVVNLLLRGFISFFMHYLMHRIPFFWRLHRVHHLDTDLDVTSTVRFHPLEFVANTIPAVPLVVAFGLTPWVLMVYELLDVAITLFSHSNIRLPAWLDAAFCRVIVTPDLHRVHHSTWQPETDSNFGAVFPIWDMIFGTYRVGSRDAPETMRLGLDELRHPQANELTELLRSAFRKSVASHTVQSVAPRV
jgi:sterol desaturase/sphingolipid hydroxylase (fatty acid hydroxylase superfamily)